MAFPVIPRRSATLMLAVRNQLANQQSSVGYKLLMLQRSSKSKFMPNSYVFPGGVSETTDFSPEWLDLIGHNSSLTLKPTIIDAPFYKSCANQLPKGSLPAHIGFRICAIRETFEESGILLVRSTTDVDEPGRLAGCGSKILTDDEVKTWRERVHSDSSSFIQLCRQIQCVPDIWSLHEWSNWVTPAHIHQRFNTMFYLVFLESEPQMSHDGQEVTSSTWINPEESIMLCLGKKLNLAPPQFYEMARLCRFSTIDELKTFVMLLEGVEHWESVGIKSIDGDSVFIFPGDYMYEQVKRDSYKHYDSLMKGKAAKDFKQRLPLLQVPETTHELFAKTHNLNRLTLNFKTSFFRANCTVKLKYNMPTPFPYWNAKL